MRGRQSKSTDSLVAKVNEFAAFDGFKRKLSNTPLPTFDATVAEFVAQCLALAPLAVGIKLECELCHDRCFTDILYVYNGGDDYFAHEHCWEKRTKDTVEQYFTKQFHERSPQQVELKRVAYASTEELTNSVLSSFDFNSMLADCASSLTRKPKKRRVVRRPPPTVIRDKPKPEDKRGKELGKVSAMLEAKEPVRLAVAAVPVPTAEPVFVAPSNKRCCTLCTEVITTSYVLVKPCAAADLLCHERCWDTCTTKSGEIKRLYRYDAAGKCLQKLSFAPPPSTVPEKEAALVAPPIPEPVKEEKQVESTPERVPETIKEYQPSWREVDVHDYERLKKESVREDKEKQDRRRAKKDAKAAKFIDLAPYQEQREKELRREGNKLWREIFREIPAEPRIELVPRPVKEEPFATAACAVLTPTLPTPVPRPKAAHISLVWKEKEPNLLPDAAEFIPAASVPTPPSVLFCLTCRRNPCSIINFPCYRVTLCEHCCNIVRECAVCGCHLPSYCTYLY